MRGRRELRAATALVRQLGDPNFAREWLLAGWRREQGGRAPAVDLMTAYPQAECVSVDLGAISYTPWNMDPTERFVVGALARIKSPRRVFEIGTFDGSATLVLVRNAPDATIETLDLPTDHPESAVTTGGLRVVGERVLGEPRVHQHFGDSRSFDFTQWDSSMDMVLVDAGHRYEDVRADTEAALRMLAQGGMIVWDDYTSRWPGVVRAVDETELPVFRVLGTELAIYDMCHRHPAA